jgi:hypothetical protein
MDTKDICDSLDELKQFNDVADECIDSLNRKCARTAGNLASLGMRVDALEKKIALADASNEEPSEAAMRQVILDGYASAVLSGLVMNRSAHMGQEEMHDLVGLACDLAECLYKERSLRERGAK